MSFAQPRSTTEFLVFRAMPASIVLAAIWAMGGLNIPPIEQPQPVGPYPVPPDETPYPTGQDGQRFPSPGEKPPLEAPRPTYH